MTKKNKLELESLLLKQNKQIKELIKKVDNLEVEFRRFQAINFIRFIIIAVPVIITLLYLIPVLRQFLEIYKPLIELLNQFKVI